MKKILLYIVSVCCLFSFFPSIKTYASEKQVIRVAYPIQARLTDIDESGNYTGYTYEYLEEIAQYTGWDYEYVQIPGDINESLTTLMEMVKNGEIDLMGNMLYSEQLAEDYDYSSQSYGAVETVLQVLTDNVQVPVINSQITQTLKIAVLKQSKRLMQELEDYCEMNMIIPDYVYCESYEDQVRALKEGKAQFMLNTSLNYLEDVRTIAKFASKPYYFVTSKNSNLMETLNSAILSIEQSNPYFSTTLYDKYFLPPSDRLVLSESEQEYVSACGSLKVGVLTNRPPFQYTDPSTGDLSGISADLLHYISEKTGLSFTLVPFDSEQDLYDSAKAGEIVMYAGMEYNYESAQKQNLSMSQPYTSSQYTLLMNKDVSKDSLEGKKLVLPSFSPYKDWINDQVLHFDTTKACMQALVSGKADYTYMDINTAQYYLNLAPYSSLKMISQTYEPQKICFGLTKPINKNLLSIINKCINTISDEDLQLIIYQNTYKKQPFSLKYYIRENPIQSIVIISGILILVIAMLSFILRQRIHMNRQAQLELKKHFQIYALVDEYFFEYDYRKNRLLISVPQKDNGGSPHITQYDFTSPSETHDLQFSEKAFLDIIKSEHGGIKELQIPFSDGSLHWVRIALEVIYNNKTPLYSLGKINFIDQEHMEKEELLAKAQLDSLTHALNAETGKQKISQALGQLKESEQGAFLLIDIDCFKQINDTCGHLQGDKTLIQVARLLKSAFRSTDIVGRPGGDEFVVYMTSVKNRQALAHKCKLLCESVHQLSYDHDHQITISLGAAISRQGDTYDNVYEKADKALYYAKRHGRNQYKITDPD